MFFRIVKLALYLQFCLSNFIIYAQNENSEIEDFLLNNANDLLIEESSMEDLEESIEFYSRKLNLNTASQSQLLLLPFLKSKQVSDIISHRNEFGDFTSIYELQNIQSIDQYCFRQLLKFAIVDASSTDKDDFKSAFTHPDLHYLLIRQQNGLEKSIGYTESGSEYLGSSYKSLYKYKIQKSSIFSFGLTVEKDAGEQLINSQFQPEFLSSYLLIENLKPFKRIILGDFKIQYGQSLIYGAGFSLGKGSDPVLSIKRNDVGIIPYSSSTENGFFRGIALNTEIKKLDFSTFLSYKNLDASFNETDKVQSIMKSGYHRTSSEIENKASLNEISFGFHILKKWRNTNIGINNLNQVFDREFFPANNYYGHHSFQGKNNSLLSLTIDYYLKNINLYGETACDNNMDMAHIYGALIPLSQRLDLAFQYRKFTPGFTSFYGNAFAESNKLANETGKYVGFNFQLSRNTKFSAFADMFNFNTLKYQRKSSSYGQDLFFNVQHAISFNNTVGIRYRNKRNDRVYSSESNSAINNKIQTITINHKVDLNKNLSLSSRLIKKCTQDLINSEGFALSEEIEYSFTKFSIKSRLTFFETDDFSSAIYILEKDVLYAFSAPALYGIGSRFYAVLKYRLNKKTSFWFRYDSTKRYDVEKIGTGNEELSGNFKSSLKFQMILRL